MPHQGIYNNRYTDQSWQRVSTRKFLEAASNIYLLQFQSLLICIIIIIIIKRGWQCKAGRERLTPYQSEDPHLTTPTHRKKEEKGKTVGDKK